MIEEKTKSLKARFLLLTTLVFCVIAGVSFVFISQINKSVTHALGSRFAENQLLYDKARVLLPLSREVALARKLADSTQIKLWAKNENDPELKKNALRELEDYRRFFRDGSYFFVIHKSLNYYFNDNKNSYQGRQLRYRISITDPEDGWYFSAIQSGEPHQLNVDFDEHLGVTKVWINVPVRENNEVLGVIGTGIDLTTFIQTILIGRYDGITNIFLEKSGAIQAHPDVSSIDFRTLTKDPANRKTIFQLIENPSDQEKLKIAMEAVRSGKRETATFFLALNGQNHLAGVTYLPNIRWFNLTLISLDQLVPKRYFTLVVILLFFSLLVASAVIAYLLNKTVLSRVATLNASVEQMMGGNLNVSLDTGDNDEIGSLTRNFSTMAKTIRTNTETLEKEVSERTEELKRLSERDSMTKLFNRRGMMERWESEINRISRSGTQLGVLILDIDLFKKINDNYGHKVGDFVITSVATALRNAIRSYDHCARWGGEEFLILLPDCTEDGLTATAEKVLQSIRGLGIEVGESTVSVTVSIGGYLASYDESPDSMISKADLAMYEGKKQGRDRYVRYTETLGRKQEAAEISIA